MRHCKHRFKLNRTSSHRSALGANLIKSLIMYKKIRTTVAKAKAFRSVADKMITLAKKGDLSSIRKINSALKIYRDYSNKHTNLKQASSNNVAIKMLMELAEANRDRNGGYSRIIRTKQRKGDAAELCVLEYITTALKKEKAD